MVRKILAIVSLVGLITMALIAYSLTSSVSETQEAVNSTVDGYKQQLTDKVKEITAPTLQKLGIDVEKVNSDDLNIVKRKIEEASDAVRDASEKIGK